MSWSCHRAIHRTNLSYKARTLVTLFIVTMLAGCSATTVPAPSAASSPLAVATPTPTPTPTRTVVPLSPLPLATASATNYAIVCGTASDFVKTTPTTNGSVALNSPGRTPLRVVFAVARNNPEGPLGGYVCMSLDAGTPYPIFAGLGVPGREGFVAEGAYPATLAMPAPAGFVLPQSCAYVAPPMVVSNETLWIIDCGPDANRDPRGVLSAAARQQGWIDCGPALSTAIFVKGTSLIRVFQRGGPDDYPRFIQAVTTTAAC